LSYQPPQYQPPAPPPPPQRRRRPIWQWGCGALLLLIVCGGIAAIVSPKTPSSPVPAASVPTTAPQATAAPLPTDTAVVAQVPPTQAPPTVVPSPTEDLALSLQATITAEAKLPPNVRYAPAGCTSGVQYGSLCKDGSFSETMGQGACSGHKGVQQKLVCP
jgi:hypothetical protein